MILVTGPLSLVTGRHRGRPYFECLQVIICRAGHRARRNISEAKETLFPRISDTEYHRPETSRQHRASSIQPRKSRIDCSGNYDSLIHDKKLHLKVNNNESHELET